MQTTLTILEYLKGFWPHLVSASHIVLSLWASSHAILNKRDSRSAVLWVGLIWLSPLLGPFFYWVFGINRIRMKARVLSAPSGTFRTPVSLDSLNVPSDLKSLSPAEREQLISLARFGNSTIGTALTSGNDVQILKNGDAAYPEMLRAIQTAKKSINLATYIFNNDKIGAKFVEALEAAKNRGVDVRVLLDAAGARYSFPTVVSRFKKSKIRFAKFLPTLNPLGLEYMNLRNHRKILVVDGKIGFTGGMNISDGNVTKAGPRHPIQDLHFKLTGPVVGHLQHAFAEDWQFSTDEVLDGDTWFSHEISQGNIIARGIPDGPGEDLLKIHWALLGAIKNAKKSIRILTPYFLPDGSLLTALNVAAASGVPVEVIIPEENNIKFVHWAAMATIPDLLERGCRFYLSAPPFDHSKIMIVDSFWALIGSSNWDARSLRLNFEFNVECYSPRFAGDLESVFEEKKQKSRELLLSELRDFPLPLKLRNGIAKLATPYL